MNPRVFGFGSATVDFRINTAEYGPGYVDKLLAQETRPLGGGSVANTLVQIARLGGGATWFGKLGRDWIGDEIVRGLDEDGVDTSCVIRADGVCSPFNVAVYADSWNRRIGGFLLPNALNTMTNADVSAFLPACSAGDWLIVEIGEVRLELVQHLCTEARLFGVNVLIDVDLDPVKQCGATEEVSRAILGMADVLVPNRASMRMLYGSPSADDLVRDMAAEYEVPVVITAGDEGAWWCVPGDDPVQQMVYPAQAVDTVGAGDAFHGGFVFGLAQGWDMTRCVDIAARCGAAACARRGARTSMPTREEIGMDLLD